MRKVLVFALTMVAAGGCKKGGGGGGWLVGDRGMLAHVDEAGQLVRTDDLATEAPLYALACRHEGEAWAVGANGTVRYTSDGAQTWVAQAVPTRADLHALATATEGPIYIGGDGVLLISSDSGATWTLLPVTGDVRSLAAPRDGATVFAITSDGGVWFYDGAALTRRATVPGARAIALAADGATAVVAGDGLWLSSDGGTTWSPLSVDHSLAFADVHVSGDGLVTAVGARGAIATGPLADSIHVQELGAVDLYAVHIADAASEDGVGFAAGAGGALFVTHDDGTTWSAAPSLARTVWSIDEIGSDHR